MNLNEILNIVNYFSAKDNEGNTFSPVQYNNLLPFAQNKVFRTKYHFFETEQKIVDALLPFTVFMGQLEYIDQSGNTILPNIAPLEINDNGYGLIPADYKHYVSLKYLQASNKDNCEVKIKHRDIVPLSNQEFDAMSGTGLKRATHKYPCCNFQNGFIRFLPKDLHRVNFVYIREPIIPVYAYTIDPNTQQVIYDNANSVQCEFNFYEQMELIIALLEAVSINLSLTELQQFVISKQQEAVAL